MYILYVIVRGDKMTKLFNVFKKYRKHIFITIIILAIGTVTYIYGKGGDEVSPTEQKPPITIPTEKKEVKPTYESIIFDIKGAVVNPGAYKLDSDKRIYDAIRVSGGLTNDADTSLINLSKKLIDEMVIIIHTKDEVADYFKKEPTIVYKDVECNCPLIINDGCINEKNNDNQKASKVSLNKASIDELMNLPGIGEAKAKSIIEFRKTIGSFKSIEELIDVKGIGESVFNSLKDLITI